jgi:ankyrin repeat protein
MSASKNGHRDIVDLLLKNGANLDSQQSDGWTSLMLASQNGHRDIVDLLLQNGVAVDTKVDTRRNDDPTPSSGTQSYRTSFFPAQTK